MTSAFEIIAENTDFLVINKLLPISFHSESGEAGLFEQVKQQRNLSELYPVHRLDKVTTGILVFGKTVETARILGAQFEQRLVQKYYFAISAKKPTKKQGAIIGDMAPARNGAWKLLHTKENPAVTQFFSVSIEPSKRLYIIKPSTGKTHQIRVALKSLGSPILGDELYGGDPADRVYLHSYSIQFELEHEVYIFKALPQFGKLFTQSNQIENLHSFLTPSQLPWPKI